MSLNSLSEPMLFKRIVYWNWFGPGPSSLGSSFVMHPCPSHGQMGRPRPTIIKVCMSLAIHQTKRDRRKMERDAQSSKDSGDNSAVCRWVCSSTASIFCISVQMSCIVCCSATNQTIWTIIYIYIWKSATFMNCEFKSHLYRCHLPKSFFFYYYYSIEKTRTSLVGQRAFCVTWVSCASLSRQLFYPFTRSDNCIKSSFLGVLKWIGIAYRIDIREKAAQMWKEKFAGSFVL